MLIEVLPKVHFAEFRAFSLPASLSFRFDSKRQSSNRPLGVLGAGFTLAAV
jgi:hypothetical protein